METIEDFGKQICKALPKIQAKSHVLAGCLLNHLFVLAVDLQLRVQRLLQQAGDSDLVAVQIRY